MLFAVDSMEVFHDFLLAFFMPAIFTLWPLKLYKLLFLAAQECLAADDFILNYRAARQKHRS
jgi:hypothetical protein